MENLNHDNKPTFIFIDGSYFCFYRYFALINWWKNAYPEEILDDPIQNIKFVDKFKKNIYRNNTKITQRFKN